MNPEFCEHLEQYGLLYAETDTAYQNCLTLMDRFLAGDAGDNLVYEIKESLDGWERQTRTLRSNFVVLTEKGHVLLPREGQNTSPVCGHCGGVVPRLEFPEFKFEDDGTVLFRGQELLAPEMVLA